MGTSGKESFVFCLNKCKYPYRPRKDSLILLNKCNSLWAKHEVEKHAVVGSVCSDAAREVHHKTHR